MAHLLPKWGGEVVGDPQAEELPVPATAEKWRANGGGGFQSRNHATESSNRKEKQPALCGTDIGWWNEWSAKLLEEMVFGLTCRVLIAILWTAKIKRDTTMKIEVTVRSSRTIKNNICYFIITEEIKTLQAKYTQVFE